MSKHIRRDQKQWVIYAVTSSDGTCVVFAYGQNGLRHIGGVISLMAATRNVGTSTLATLLVQLKPETSQVGSCSRGQKYGSGVRGAEHLVVVEKPSNVGGAKGMRSGVLLIEPTLEDQRKSL